MKKIYRFAALGLVACLSTSLFTACGKSETQTTETSETTTTADTETEEASEESSVVAENTQEENSVEETQFEETQIQVFIAASLSSVMEELAEIYQEKQPNVTITFNADSSGTLLTQIQEGYACDVFFSAAQKQMNTLEEDGMLVDGTRHDVVNNQVCVVTYTGSDTKVTGLMNLSEASSIALADGSVPVGKYTRQAMINAGMLTVTDGEEASDVTTQEISDALGVEINECGNVSKVRTAIVEHANEVGTVYYSDTYGFEDQLVILEKVSYDLTGNVIYPIAQVKNSEADELESAAAADFVEFIASPEAKEVFDKYLFDTDL